MLVAINDLGRFPLSKPPSLAATDSQTKCWKHIQLTLLSMLLVGATDIRVHALKGDIFSLSFQSPPCGNNGKRPQRYHVQGPVILQSSILQEQLRQKLECPTLQRPKLTKLP